MNKSSIMLTVLFTISTCSHANIFQLADYETPGSAAQKLTPNTVVPSTPQHGTTLVPPSLQNNPGNSSVNCNNPPGAATPDVDVPSIAGSAPALGT